MKDLAALYPELQKFDGLPQALQSGLSNIFPDLQYRHGISFSKLKQFSEHFDRVRIYHSSTELVSKSDIWADVDIAVEQKLYILTLGVKKEQPQIYVETSALEQVVPLLSAWFSNTAIGTELSMRDSCVTFLNLEDDAQYIHWQWVRRHRQAVNCGIFTHQLAPLFYEAMHDPVLSQITPYTSHSCLYMSRYTEFPFDSSDLPIACPLLSIGIEHHYRSILQEQNFERAEKELSSLPSEIGMAIRKNQQEYEFTDPHGEIVFRDEPISLLEKILEYTKESYDILNPQEGNGITAKDAKQAVELLRNALPPDWHKSIRGSAPRK